MRKSLAGLTVIFLILTVLGAMFYLNPSIFNGLNGNTTLSISQINVDPQGAPVGDDWTGSFWNILAYVNANDDLAGVVLPKDQTGSVTYQGAVDALKTGAKVEIKIDPGQPYLIRDVQEKIANVVPADGQTYVSQYLSSDRGESFTNQAYALNLHYYGWGEATWRIYTPFTVSIYKDDVLVGSQTLDMEGSSAVQSVSTSEGAVRIENLGILGGQYLSPNAPVQIAIIKGYPNVYDYSQIQNIIQYNQGVTYQAYQMNNQLSSVTGAANTYCGYWYGTNYVWTSNKQPAGIVSYGTYSSNMIQSSIIGGWQSADDSVYFRRNPVTPVVGSSDKNNLPSDKRSFYSVLEYIEQGKGIHNLATTLFNTQSAGYAGALWQKASFVTDTNGQTALRLDIPWSAFGTPLVSIRVPTELADTFVERPIITSTQVSGSWESTGTKYCDVYGSDRIAVQVTNTGTVTGSSLLAISSGNSKLTVTPLSMTVNNLAPNEVQTVYFDATNLGVDTKTDNVPITITASDTYTGSTTGTDIVYGSLMPTLVTGTTTLNLHVVEKGTDTPIEGLQLTVQYAGSAPTPFTNANGDVTMTLTTPQGGAFIGNVDVQSADTPIYKPSTATYNLVSATSYDYTLQVERKDTQYTQPFVLSLTMMLLIVAVVGAISVAGGVSYYKSKHHAKIGKRRRR